MTGDGDKMSWMMALLTDLMGKKCIIVALLTRDCTDGTHSNYVGLFSKQNDDDDPLLSFMYAYFIWSSKIVSYRSHIKQISLMLLMRLQKQTGR